MSFTLGIYDLFLYLIPGAFFFTIIMEVAKMSGIQKLINFNLISIDLGSLGNLLILGIISFILGLLLHPIEHKIWFPFFRPKKYISQQALDRMIAFYPNVDIKFQANQWPVIFAHIRKTNLNLAEAAERQKAVGQMLEVISFELFILGLVEVFQFFFYRSIQPMPIFFILGMLCLLLSVVAMRASFTFEKWYFWTIFEIAISDQIDIKEWVVKKEQKSSVEEDVEETLI